MLFIVLSHATLLKDIILSIAAITTSIVAIVGLTSWKREMKGSADFDVARAFIRSAYKLRDELRMARSPFYSNAEYPEGYSDNLMEQSPQDAAKAWAYAFQNRWKPVSEAVLEFEAQAIEAEVLWGGDIKTHANELKQCAYNLRAAMEAFVSNKASGGENFKSDQVFAKKVKSDVMLIKETENELSKAITTSIQKLETYIRPKLKHN